jgi:hypothetical protein
MEADDEPLTYKQFVEEKKRQACVIASRPERYIKAIEHVRGEIAKQYELSAAEDAKADSFVRTVIPEKASIKLLVELMKEKIAMVKDHLPASVRPTLCIVTNLNTPPNYFNRFMDRLEAFTEVFDIEILISAESLGARAEYIRNGVDWQRFESNINKLFARKDVKFTLGFLMSINVLSIATTKEFVQWATELSKKYDRVVHFKQNIVNYPLWQAPLLLPPEFAKYVDDAIEYMEQHVDDMPIATDFSGRYDQYIIFLKSLSDSIKNNTANHIGNRKIFHHWFKQFDEKRKLNFEMTFPEYVEFSEHCRKL